MNFSTCATYKALMPHFCLIPNSSFLSKRDNRRYPHYPPHRIRGNSLPNLTPNNLEPKIFGKQIFLATHFTTTWTGGPTTNNDAPQRFPTHAPKGAADKRLRKIIRETIANESTPRGKTFGKLSVPKLYNLLAHPSILKHTKWWLWTPVFGLGPGLFICSHKLWEHAPEGTRDWEDPVNTHWYLLSVNNKLNK